MRNKLILLTLLLLNVLLLIAAPFQNIEKILTQPDGTKLYCFASGDEFYNRLHDAEGYTIVQAQNGYFVYADYDANGNVVPTQHIAGKTNPKTLGLKPYVQISVQEYQKRREAKEVLLPRTNENLNHGVYNNLVIFIKFKGDSDFTTTKTEIDSMFNYDGYYDISMNNYFKKATYNQLSMMSYCYPVSDDDKILAYEDIYPRNYYQPYNETTNPEGYTNQAEREFPLLKRAVEYVADQVPDTLNIDRDNDGYIDNIIFVVKGNVGDWADLLWPHMWSMVGETAYINGKKVGTFNFQLETSTYFSVSTLCHEMSHSLGLPDLYHYHAGETLSPSGPWDLMCGNANPPQHTSTYMKYKYGTWIDEIPEIGYGTYTIEANSWEGGRRNCYKIPSSHPRQYYLLEYRNKNNFFEKGLPGSGLLIYRIDTRFHGCADYDGNVTFDEVYIFRPGGDYDDNGNINEAAFSKENNRTEFNYETNPYPFLNKNQEDLLFNICNVSEEGDRMTFTYCPIMNLDAPQNLTANVNVNENFVELRWNEVEDAKSYNIFCNDSLIANVTENHYEDVYSDDDAGYRKYHVTAVADNDESYRSDVEPVVLGGFCEYQFNMKTAGINGWQGGEIMLSFDNDMDDVYLTMYSGNEITKGIIVPEGVKMTLSWLTGWDDSECSFTVTTKTDTVYQSSNMQEGFLTEIVAVDESSCVIPKNLTAEVDGAGVKIKWMSSVENKTFTIFRDNEIIAEDVKGYEYEDKTITSTGMYHYHVVSTNADCESLPLESVSVMMITVDNEKMNLEVESEGSAVNLSWNAATINGGALKYDDGAYVTSVGTNSYNCAIMFPAELLGLYKNTKLTHVELYAATNAEYVFKIYNGDEPKNQNLIHTESFTLTKENDFVKLSFSEEIPFDVDENLWITFKSSGSDSAPIPCADFMGSEYSNLIKNGSKWIPATHYNMEYSWMLRAYVSFPDGLEDMMTYDVYRDGQLLAEGVKALTYTDANVEEETCYTVEARIDGSFLAVSDEVCVDKEVSDTIMLRPNPTDGILTIAVDNLKNVKIYSLLGSVILDHDVSGDTYVIDMRRYGGGTYVIQLTTDDDVFTEKVLVY